MNIKVQGIDVFKLLNEVQSPPTLDQIRQLKAVQANMGTTFEMNGRDLVAEIRKALAQTEATLDSGGGL